MAAVRAGHPAVRPSDRPATAPPGAGREPVRRRKLKLGALLGPARRAGWGLADQALSSLSNVAVGVLVARSSTVAEFGVYALAFGGYTIALNASRAVATEPLAVRHSGDRTPVWRRAVSASTATALAVGLLALVAGLAIAAVPGVPARGVLIAFAAAMPGLLLQDTWRWAFFVVGDGRRAFFNDLVWLVAMGVVFGLLFLTGHASATLLVLGWGGGAAVGAVFGRYQSRLLPDARRVRGWLREHADLTPKYLAEMVLMSGTVQVYMLGITAVAGIAAVSGIRGAQILMGPVNVLNQGIRAFAVPEAARALLHSARRLRLVGLAVTTFVGLGALCWGAIFLVLPDGVGRALLGPAVWAEAEPVLVPVILLWALGAANAGAFAILRALAAAGRGLGVRVVSSVLFVAAALGGAATAGALGAAWALAIVATVTLVLWWWQALRALAAQRTVTTLE